MSNSSPIRRRRAGILRLTVCALLSALGLVILSFGTLLEVLELTVVMLASLLIVPVVIEYRGVYPWSVYAVTSTCALLLLPTKATAFSYVIFGFYPILKAYLERLPRLLCLFCKEIVFLILEATLLVTWNFLIGFEDAPPWYNLCLTILGFVALHLFDLSLSRLIRAYLNRYRSLIRKWMGI